MISWSIAAAQESRCFERILVSTDDDEIAELSRGQGADTPFVRPAELSDDQTTTTAVVGHAVEWLSAQGELPPYVCCLYATAPFVRAEDIRSGLEQLRRHECDYAFSVARYASPIQRALRLDEQGRLQMLEPRNVGVRSQDLEDHYHDAGQFYWGTAGAWLSRKPVLAADAVPVILPREFVQDIDTEADWVNAEWMFRAMQSGSGNRASSP